jgi:hypothetical protein
VTEVSRSPEPARDRSLKALADEWPEHLGMMLTLGYLAVTIVGMVSSWALYARFGVNVFHFAQIGDFLLAATAWPLASLSVVFALVAIAIIMRLDRWADRYRWYRLMYFDSDRARSVFRSRPMLAVYAALYVWLATVMHANWYESRLRSGEGARVRVELQSGTYLGRMGTTPFEAALIGATSGYVFLYDAASAQATVVPLENLASLVPLGRPAARRNATPADG